MFKSKKSEDISKEIYSYYLKYLNNKLLLQVIFDRDIQRTSEYLGLLNDGNICYMNSLLQVLYHCMPLRKIIVEQPRNKENKNNIFIRYLQEIFIDLMTSADAPSSDKLLDHF